MEKTLSSRVVFRGRALTVRVDTVETEDGRESTREIVQRSDCVAVVAVDPAGNILLVKQYRQAVGKELLEIPAGGIDGDETPEEAVIREMQEETGYLPRRVERLGGFYASPGYCTEYLYLYLATDLVPGRLHAEDTDAIKLVKVSPAEVSGLISSEEIRDSKSIAGLLTYLHVRKIKDQR